LDFRWDANQQAERDLRSACFASVIAVRSPEDDAALGSGVLVEHRRPATRANWRVGHMNCSRGVRWKRMS